MVNLQHSELLLPKLQCVDGGGSPSNHVHCMQTRHNATSRMCSLKETAKCNHHLRKHGRDEDYPTTYYRVMAEKEDKKTTLRLLHMQQV